MTNAYRDKPNIFFDRYFPFSIKECPAYKNLSFIIFYGFLFLIFVSTPIKGQAQTKTSSSFVFTNFKIICPYPPGGGTDNLSRAIALKLSEEFKVPAIVDNRNGANGSIGAGVVAKSVPDGQTLLVVPAGFAANPAIYKNLPYDQAKDLTAVSLLASGPLVLVVHPSLNVKTVKELIALVKSKPGQINYGSAGIGSLPHLTGELFNLKADIKLVHIPYKGAGPAVIDLLAGIVPVYFMNIIQALPLIKDGKLIALGVTSPQRSPKAPNIPAIIDDIPGFDMTNWYGMLAPSNTPNEQIQVINQAVNKALNAASVKEKLDQEGMSVIANSPAQFNEFLKKEMVKYNQIIKAAGIQN